MAEIQQQKSKGYRILFISLVIMKDLEKRGIYPDLIKYFIRMGHHVTILSPVERREKGGSEIRQGEGYTNVRYKTLNNTKTNYVEKLLSTFVIDLLLKRTVKKKLNGHFDIIVFATPPITLTRTISYIRHKFKAPCYLLLKDIFPDNIRDLGMLSETSLFYKYFRTVEKKLYSLADHIGCMSPANVTYLLTENPEIPAYKVEVNPNTIDYIEPVKDKSSVTELKSKYNISEKARVFFYGGNLGKPQMIDFLIEVMAKNLNNPAAHFLIVGNGTEFKKIQKWITNHNPNNVTLLSFVPKSEYDMLIHVGDIGLVLLDRRFRIPNFPNRILSYMENYMPVLLATDKNTDIGSMAVDNKFGLWCESGDLETMNTLVNQFATMPEEELKRMGHTGNTYMKTHFYIDRSYKAIIEKIK